MRNRNRIAGLLAVAVFATGAVGAAARPPGPTKPPRQHKGADRGKPAHGESDAAARTWTKENLDRLAAAYKALNPGWTRPDEVAAK